MTTNSSTSNAKENFEGMKKDIENLIKRLSDVKDEGGDILSEQLNHLGDAISEYRQKGKRKSKEMLEEVTSSTKQHPLRNLLYAFGIGAVLSLILK